MILRAFEPCIAFKIREWNLDDDYCRFWRNKDRYLSLDECEHLPQVLNSEVLMVGPEKDLLGLVAIQEDKLGSRFSILIEKALWNKGLGSKALGLLELYLFNKKMTRSIITECSIIDEASNKALLDNGFRLIGTIPEQIYNKGQFEDVNLYYKKN